MIGWAYENLFDDGAAFSGAGLVFPTVVAEHKYLYSKSSGLATTPLTYCCANNVAAANNLESCSHHFRLSIPCQTGSPDNTPFEVLVAEQG